MHLLQVGCQTVVQVLHGVLLIQLVGVAVPEHDSEFSAVRFAITHVSSTDFALQIWIATNSAITGGRGAGASSKTTAIDTVGFGSARSNCTTANRSDYGLTSHALGTEAG